MYCNLRGKGLCFIKFKCELKFSVVFISHKIILALLKIMTYSLFKTGSYGLCLLLIDLISLLCLCSVHSYNQSDNPQIYKLSRYRNTMQCIAHAMAKISCKNIDRDRTRTCNPRLRKPMPSPLGHTAVVAWKYFLRVADLKQVAIPIALHWLFLYPKVGWNN